MARVSKYIEFLESGICSSLKGDTGAYKFCEEIIRQDIQIENQGIIINKLSELVKGFTDMNKTNIMMYHALCDVNQKINLIQHESEQQSQSLNEIQSNMVLLEKNTQVTSHFSEITAKTNQSLVEYAEYQDFVSHQKRLEEGKYY